MSETDPRNEPVSPDQADTPEASEETAVRPGDGETAAAEGAPEAGEPVSAEVLPAEASLDSAAVPAESSAAEALDPEASSQEEPAAASADPVEAHAELAPEEEAAEVAEAPEPVEDAIEEAAAVSEPEEAEDQVEDPAATDEPAPEEAPAAEKAPAREEAPAAAASNGEQPAGTIGVPGMDWYIIHSYSGFENKVRESLRTRADAFGFGERIGEILIPTEDVVEMRNGKKVTSKRLLYPGYVLVQLNLDDELWHVVKNTPRVTGFVGGGQSPAPLSADEVNQILYRQTTSEERPRPKLSFDKNDRVKIIDGPFTNFTGAVEEVNTDRNTLKVMVTIFGRATPVELEYFQVEKEQV